ncbi:hypothetical protein HKW82_23675, partial [Pseudomonas aeruginosa]|nr:hypothetical protein [Pseudomonas aeruginosa]
MTISIRGARVIDPASGLDQVGDLHIEAGKIVAIGAAPAEELSGTVNKVVDKVRRTLGYRVASGPLSYLGYNCGQPFGYS